MTLGEAVFGITKKGGEEFFRKKIRGEDFFQLEKGGQDFFSEEISGVKIFSIKKRGQRHFLANFSQNLA